MSKTSKLKQPAPVRVQPVVSPRERLMSYFSWLIGGWNASPGTSSGRLHFEPNYEDDEAMARMLLKNHERDAKRDLELEVQRLKAELYDAKRANDQAQRPAEHVKRTEPK